MIRPEPLTPSALAARLKRERVRRVGPWTAARDDIPGLRDLSHEEWRDIQGTLAIEPPGE